MKRKAYILLPVIFILSFLLPILVFTLQDWHDIQKEYHFDQIYISSDIAKEYPVISEIYASFYTQGESTETENQYLINFSSSTPEDQETYADIKLLYEQEIRSLIDKSVITNQLVNNDKNAYTIDFGSLLLRNRHLYNLSQIFSMEENKVVSTSFDLLKESKKITALDISNEAVELLNQEDCKEIMRSMIQYLGLEDIEDWSYTDNGYESYIAKLQVYCEIRHYGNGYPTLEIGIIPLGQHSSYNFKITSAG
ncbi:MAG: hypothetical protein ACLROI_02905 [Beduini sp.]|uniref:hypothetical protein n=1 Tax=Beduini sp. TaxID=1922300 RepID=UPI0011CA34D0